MGIFLEVDLQFPFPPSPQTINAFYRFHATLYACPDTTLERQQVKLQVTASIAEVDIVLQNSKAVKDSSLKAIAIYVQEWQQKVGRGKLLGDVFMPPNLSPSTSPHLFPIFLFA